MLKTIVILSISIFSLATYAEAKNNNQDFDFTSIGFHGFYDLEIYEENGQTVARSIYDPIDSPHYIFNEEKNTWEDNHPGRNDIELLFPPVRVFGRTIWKELAGYEWIEQSKSYIENKLNRAEWNQDLLAYEYVNLHHDEGHEIVWEPMMGLLEISDENKGVSNHCETLENNEYKIGFDGLKVTILISGNHPDIEYVSSEPNELASEYYSQLFLNNFPELKGKHLIVRIIDEDITNINKTQVTLNREFWLQGDGTKMLNQFVPGYVKNVSKNVDLITLSIGVKEINPIIIYYGIIWALSAESFSSNIVDENKKLDIGSQVDDILMKKIIQSGLTSKDEFFSIKRK